MTLAYSDCLLIAEFVIVYSLTSYIVSYYSYYNTCLVRHETRRCINYNKKHNSRKERVASEVVSLK